jgi:hypothetical protein
MTRPFDGATISLISLIVALKGAQHHGGHLFRRVIGMKRPPPIGRTDQPVVLLSCQQNELALAASRDHDRPSERSLDDLTGSITQIGQRKVCHPKSPSGRRQQFVYFS